jgi:hypothetical protein
VSTRRVVAVAVTIFLLAAGVASAAVTVEFLFGTLTAESDGADPIVVGCSGGTAKVNGADPDGDPAPCSAVESVEITGGPGPNAIDLSAVTQTAFPGAEYVSITGDEGADTITGSALADEVEGEADGDTLRGNAGNDALSGGEGDDRVLGGAGDDTLSAKFGNDSLDGQVGSDRYQLDLSDLGPAVRVADTGTEGTDAIELSDCEGVTVETGRISFQDTRVAVSGIESYPCGYTPPPEPPAPPPPAAKENCIVPRLRGRTLTKAKALLARAHCSVGKVTRVRSRVKRGVVIRQSPRAGLRRARGAKVALRVSRGP